MLTEISSGIHEVLVKRDLLSTHKMGSDWERQPTLTFSLHTHVNAHIHSQEHVCAYRQTHPNMHIILDLCFCFDKKIYFLSYRISRPERVRQQLHNLQN